MKRPISHNLKAKLLLFIIFLLVGCTPADHGLFQLFPGNSRVIVSAPHAESDLNTGEIVKAIAARTGFSSIIVANGRSLKSRYNVNRPTIGGGLACSSEPATDAAKEVYENYRARVFEMNPKPLLYVEIHGEAGNYPIQTATKGVTLEEATRLKRIYTETRDRYLKERPELFSYDLLIEPVDKIRLAASCAKKIGIFRDFNRVIHLELPNQMRAHPYQEVYTAILADFLSRAVSTE